MINHVASKKNIDFIVIIIIIIILLYYLFIYLLFIFFFNFVSDRKKEVVMRVGQIAPGLSSSSLLEVGRVHGGQELVAFVTEKRLFVTFRSLRVVAQHDLPDHVACLKWSSSGGGKLAVLLRMGDVMVFLLEPTSGGFDRFSLRLLSRIKLGCRGAACCWKTEQDHLLVSGEDCSLRLFDLSVMFVRDGVLMVSVSELWARSDLLTSPAALLCFSADNSFIASCGVDCRIVKVFQEPAAGFSSPEAFPRFFYLGHSRAVVKLEWRHASSRTQPDGTPVRNVLLTSCRDEGHRLWMEMHLLEHQIQFSLVSVLDVAPGTVVSWLQKEENEFMAASRQKQLQQDGGLFKNYSDDWLVGMDASGAIVVWGVQNLLHSSVQQKLPSVFIWNKLAPLDMIERAPRVIIASGRYPVQDKSSGAAMLHFLVLTQQGRLSSWRFALRSSLATSNRSLMGVFWGHPAHVPVTHIAASRCAPLLCSVDLGGRAIVSESMRTALSDPPIIVCEIFMLENVSSACWISEVQGTKNSDVLVVCSLSDPSELVFWQVSRVSAQARFESVFLGRARFDAVDCSALLVAAAGEKRGQVLVVGLGKVGKAAFFSVQFSGPGSPVQAQLIYNTSDSSETFVSASAAQSLFGEDGNAPKRHCILLGSSDGHVSFWGARGQRLGGFRADVEGRPIRSLKCAYDGRFATHSEGTNEVRVWELESSTSMQVTMEGVVPCSSVRVLLDWLALGNGLHSLVLVSGSSIHLLLETGTRRLQSFAVAWTDACKELESSTGEITCAASLSDGTLVFSSGSELHFATKWISDEESVSNASFFGKAEALLRPLPLYHPKVLVEYMMGGRFGMVERILAGLLEHLESGRIGLVSELPLEELLDTKESFAPPSSSSSSSSSSSASSLFDGESQQSGAGGSLVSFDASSARKLSELLSQVSLPGVTRKSQLHLLAVIDTFRQILEAGPGLDACGTRFFIALKVFQFLRKTNFGHAEFSVSNWAWAMQSQAHDVLLGHAGGANVTLDEIRVLGVPLWLRNPDKLKQVAEGLAKVQFLAKKDPFDCMLLYVALKRLSVLSKMFKVAKKDKVAEFLVNDFTQERWQTAALKNGYAMLKQQQFVQAAAFFLVAGKIRDCLGLLLKHEKDYMMAVIVARLWEGSMGGEQMRWILEEHILPLAESTADAWLMSIAKWLLGDFVASSHALLDSSVVGKPYAVALSISDFQPVVLYYTKHLLSATELVKYKKLDLPTFERLKRKTVFATLNAGCVHHCLDWLSSETDPAVVVGAVDEKPAAVVAAPALKKPAFADAGIFMAFDDGFGDMPTPDWMLPKPSVDGSSASVTATSSVQAAIQANGDSSSGAAAAGKEEIVCDQDTLKMKCALMFLVGSSSRLLQLCREEGKWDEARTFILSVSEFMEKRLKGEPGFGKRLLQQFNTYCEKYNHFVAQYVMLDPDEESREAFFTHHSWEIGSTVADCLTASSPPPSLQARNIATVANELWLCFGHFSSIKSSPASQEKVNLAVLLGRFVAAWIDADFAALHWILTGEIFATLRSEDEEQETRALLETESDESDEARNIAFDVANVVILDVLSDRVTQLISVPDGSSLEKVLVKLNPKSLEVKVVESLKRYRVDLLDGLHAKFDFVCSKFSGREEELSSSANWLSVLRATVKYRKNEAFARVCDKFLSIEALERVLNGVGVLSTMRNKISLSQHARRMDAAGQRVKFDNPLTLVHESDILQHFCVGTGEKVMIVIATSRGQAELPLEDTEAIAVGYLQQQQKFKNTSETNVMRLSPERLVNKMQNNQGPPIPPSAFLAKSDVACCVTSHPNLPFYLTAGVDGSVCLHQYGFPELLTPYRIGPTARVNSVKFSSSGSRFGAVDETGHLTLWQFDSSLESQRPYSIFQCHTKRANDVCFLESGNVIATAGLSNKGLSAANVAIWDTLIPPSQGRIAAFGGHSKGATTIVYSEAHRLLVSGGKTGEVCIWDMRMLKLQVSIPAHTLNVRALALDPTRSLLATGSSDGSLKVWSLPDMTEIVAFPDAHKQQTFTKNQSRYLTSPISTFGVMNVVFWKNKMVSSGADGRLVSRDIK